MIVCLGLLAIGHALYFSPRWVRVTTREEEATRGFSRGKLYYALAVLALVLIFHDRLYIAAGVWAILAVGDSLSNLVGRRLGRIRLPYNPEKSLAGLLTFWMGGTLGAWCLLWWNVPASDNVSSAVLWLYACVTSLLCALAESLPAVVDDNLVIGWIGVLVFPLLFSFPDLQPEVAESWSEALIVNVLAAILVLLLRWISWKGTLLAFFFGVFIYASTGLEGYLLMAAFLVLGSVATRLGMARKEELRVAQENKGRRGALNVAANGLVPFLTALFFFWIDAPLLRVAYAAAIATATFDTLSTEIGQWLGRRPFNPITFRRVAAGTEGAVSPEGTAGGAAGALAVAALAALLGWLPSLSLFYVGAAAVVGGMFESILGTLDGVELKNAGAVLNLYNTLLGTSVAAVLWVVISG